MIKIFYKMKSLSTRSISIIITFIVVISMFTLTTYMRSEFNKKPTNLESNSGKDLSAETAAILADIDNNSSISLYRKIWTYDALIFLSGAFLIYVIRGNKT